jgi:hypothetical protein
MGVKKRGLAVGTIYNAVNSVVTRLSLQGLPVVILVTSNNGDRDSKEGSNRERDNNRGSTGMCNNMVQDGVADGIPYRRLYLEKK